MTLLKYGRRIVAALVGLLMVLLFIDYWNFVPTEIDHLAKAQFVPMLVSGTIGGVVLLVVLPLLIGRLYCSVLCPLGIMQDFIYRVKRWVYRAKKQRIKTRFKYSRPLNILRYLVLGITAVTFFMGINLVVALLDPYSIFGRSVTLIFKPLLGHVNNGLSHIMFYFNNYSVYQLSSLFVTFLPLLVVVLTLVVIVVMSWRGGRKWCNSICPVGSLMSLTSRYSWLRVVINPNKCNGCKSCASVCKSQCIDTYGSKVDMSRCVVCYNCLTTCNRGAINYRAVMPFRRSVAHGGAGVNMSVPSGGSQGAKVNVASPSSGGLSSLSLSRRAFLFQSAALAAAVPFGLSAAELALGAKRFYPLPPGAVANFSSRCTGCGLCITKCPMQLLRPALFERGIERFMQPYMYFQPQSYCNFECTVCTEVCPNHALLPLSVEEKKVTQVGVVKFVKEKCVVYTEDQDCGACAEHCPTQAVHMVAYADNGLTIPQIDTSICVGCGGCESICPERPEAIYIEGHKVQQIAALPHVKEEKEQIQVDGFGF